MLNTIRNVAYGVLDTMKHLTEGEETMSTEAQVQVVEEEEQYVDETLVNLEEYGPHKIHGSAVMETRASDVHIINTQFLTPKTLGIMQSFLDGYSIDGHGLFSVVIRNDGYPKPAGGKCIWMFFKESKAAVCNLLECIDDGFNWTMYNEPGLSVRGAIWRNIIQGFYHEVHHANSFLEFREKLDKNPEYVANEEKLASEFASASMISEIKRINMEPDFSEYVEELIELKWEEEVERIEAVRARLEKKEEKWESEKAMENAKKEVRWLDYQNEIRERKLIAWMPKERVEHDDVEIKTFKHYLCLLSGGNPEDKEWFNESLSTVIEMKVTPLVDTISPQGLTEAAIENGDYEDRMPAYGDEPEASVPRAGIPLAVQSGVEPPHPKAAAAEGPTPDADADTVAGVD